MPRQETAVLLRLGSSRSSSVHLESATAQVLR
jgi:hypothetical protein